MKEQIKFFYNEEQLAIVLDCFSKALGSNPPTINPEGFYCEQENFSLETWKSNPGPRGIFSEETETLIELICGTFDKVFESNKSAYASHFYLSLELLNALKSLFSAPATELTCNLLKLRGNYLESLLKSELLLTHDMGNMLATIHLSLTTKIITMAEHASAHEKCKKNLTGFIAACTEIISQITQFSYYAIASENEPPQLDIKSICEHRDANTRSKIAAFLKLIIQTEEYRSIMASGARELPETNNQAPHLSENESDIRLFLTSENTPRLLELLMEDSMLENSHDVINYFFAEEESSQPDIPGAYSHLKSRRIVIAIYLELQGLLYLSAKCLFQLRQLSSFKNGKALSLEEGIKSINDSLVLLPRIFNVQKSCIDRLSSLTLLIERLKLKGQRNAEDDSWLANLKKSKEIRQEYEDSLSVLEIKTNDLKDSLHVMTASLNLDHDDQLLIDLLQSGHETSLQACLLLEKPFPHARKMQSNPNSPGTSPRLAKKTLATEGNPQENAMRRLVLEEYQDAQRSGQVSTFLRLSSAARTALVGYCADGLRNDAANVIVYSRNPQQYLLDFNIPATVKAIFKPLLDEKIAQQESLLELAHNLIYAIVMDPIAECFKQLDLNDPTNMQAYKNVLLTNNKFKKHAKLLLCDLNGLQSLYETLQISGFTIDAEDLNNYTQVLDSFMNKIAEETYPAQTIQLSTTNIRKALQLVVLNAQMPAPDAQPQKQDQEGSSSLIESVKKKVLTLSKASLKLKRPNSAPSFDALHNDDSSLGGSKLLALFNRKPSKNFEEDSQIEESHPEDDPGLQRPLSQTASPASPRLRGSAQTQRELEKSATLSVSPPTSPRSRGTHHSQHGTEKNLAPAISPPASPHSRGSSHSQPGLEKNAGPSSSPPTSPRLRDRNQSQPAADRKTAPSTSPPASPRSRASNADAPTSWTHPVSPPASPPSSPHVGLHKFSREKATTNLSASAPTLAQQRPRSSQAETKEFNETSPREWAPLPEAFKPLQTAADGVAQHPNSFFNSDNIDNPHMAEIINKVSALSSSSVIDLIGHRLDGLSASILCQLIMERFDKLQELNLAENSNLFDELPKTRRQDTQGLHHLPGAVAIGDLLKSHATLSTLCLRGCNLTDQSVTLLVCGLAKNTSLESLDISNNAISDKGAMDICSALTRHPTIRHLKISQNQLTEKSATHFRGLARNKLRLVTLDLSLNNIAEDSAVMVEINRILEGNLDKQRAKEQHRTSSANN